LDNIDQRTFPRKAPGKKITGIREPPVSRETPLRMHELPASPQRGRTVCLRFGTSRAISAASNDDVPFHFNSAAI
jgi:hypothetical protein